MEQIKELLDVLSKTPELALWGLGMYFVFILAKLASWVVAIKLILSELIKRYFDYVEEKLDLDRYKAGNEKALAELSREYADAREILEYFENKTFTKTSKNDLLDLLREMKGEDRYIYDSEIEAITKLVKKRREDKKKAA